MNRVYCMFVIMVGVAMISRNRVAKQFPI